MTHEAPDEPARPTPRPGAPIPPRVRAAYVLDRLPSGLASDILDSPSLTVALDVEVQHPLTLASGTPPVDRGVLFDAFRDAAEGRAIHHLKAVDGTSLDVQVSVDASTGRGRVAIGGFTAGFPDADLLAVDPRVRAIASDRASARYTLGVAEAEALRDRLAKGPLPDEEFARTALMLGATPEHFAARLAASLEKGNITKFDLLPEEAGYWDRLLPPPATATKLAAYVDGPLRERRQAWLRADPIVALRRIALEFAAPGLVPHDLLDDPAYPLAEALAPLAACDDHFTLAGVVEICARRLSRDPGLALAGEAALARLGHPDELLARRTTIFAGVFILASARLARHDLLRERPAFWRQLAAAVHASLVVRTAGVDGVNHERFLAWAAKREGISYLLSGFLDRRTSPRWRPDWMDRGHLVGDAVGRVRQAVLGIPDEVRPLPWRASLEALEGSLTAEATGILTVLPAVLEGDVDRDPQEGVPADLEEALEKFVARPSMEQVPMLAAVAFTLGLPDEAALAVRGLLADSSAFAEAEPRLRELLLVVAVHHAVARRDEPCADLVADAALGILSKVRHDEGVLAHAALHRIVECTGAYHDGNIGDDRLVARLERAAFAPVKGAVLRALGEVLADLKRVRPSLRTRLGRASAAAAIGGGPQR